MKQDIKHLEIKTIEHKGIKIRVKINYDSGEVSLLDQYNEIKKWTFAKRGLEYMKGWLDILEAMTMAIKEGKKLLEADLAEKSKFSEEVVEKLVFGYPKKKKSKGNEKA